MKKVKAIAIAIRPGKRVNYRITEVNQIHMITFWITLTLALAATACYFILA